ncbi:MAG TPA: hypothetical protein VNZ58_12710 [Thermomicrobiales bacterium]|nr:hypothetical protein [Thermomicrobiales bacterium]
MHRRAFAASLTALMLAPRIAGARSPAASPVSINEFTPIQVDGIPIALSPDGTQIAGLTFDRDLCIWDAASLETRVVSPHAREVEALDIGSLVWAPDSSALAFNLASVLQFRDSDIVVFDAETAAIVNVTGTASSETLTSLADATPEAPVNIDLYPAWSPDSSQIAFARTIYTGDADQSQIKLCHLPRQGGDSTDIVTLPQQSMPGVLPSLFWGSDDTILYSGEDADRISGKSGIFRVFLDNSDIEPVISGLMASEIPGALLVAVAADAGLATILTSGNDKMRMEDFPRWYFYLADLDSGTPTRVEDVLSLPTDGEEALDAGLFLDGPPTIVVTDADRPPTFLYNTIGRDEIQIRGQRSGEEATVLATFPLPDTSELPVVNSLLYSGVQIGTNGTILVTRPGGAWISHQEISA